MFCRNCSKTKVYLTECQLLCTVYGVFALMVYNIFYFKTDKAMKPMISIQSEVSKVCKTVCMLFVFNRNYQVNGFVYCDS